jgi:hypothetical protein
MPTRDKFRNSAARGGSGFTKVDDSPYRRTAPDFASVPGNGSDSSARKSPSQEEMTIVSRVFVTGSDHAWIRKQSSNVSRPR